MAGALVLTRLLGAVIFAPAAARTPALTLLVGTQAIDTVTYMRRRRHAAGGRADRVPDARTPRRFGGPNGRA